MGVYVQVPIGPDIDIHHTVPGHLIEHVLEKRQAGLERAPALAVQIERHVDLRFQCFSVYCCLSVRHELFSWPGKLSNSGNRTKNSNR
jgi:hypothetical protein